MKYKITTRILIEAEIKIQEKRTKTDFDGTNGLDNFKALKLVKQMDFQLRKMDNIKRKGLVFLYISSRLLVVLDELQLKSSKITYGIIITIQIRQKLNIGSDQVLYLPVHSSAERLQVQCQSLCTVQKLP